MNELLYQRVYDEIREGIESHAYPVGSRLPSQAELTELHGVSPITLKRALDLLRNDGYIVRRPKLGTFVVSDEPSSRATAGPRPLIGCVLTNFDDTFGTHVVGGLLDSTASSANLVLKRSLGDAELEDGLVRELVESDAQGLILQPSSSEYVPPAVLELVMRQFPVVILDRLFDGVPVSTVCSDNVAAAREATDYLIGLGHDRIGLIASSSRVSTAEDRRDGFFRAHAAAHIPHDDRDEFRNVRSTTPGSETPVEEDIADLRVFIRDHTDLTAYLVTEYNIAVMLREALQLEGQSVPEDVSVVCFDHPDSFYNHGFFRFTHIAQDQSGMGAAAVGCVLAQLTTPGTISKIALPTRLIEGQSTRSVVCGLRAGSAVPAP